MFKRLVGVVLIIFFSVMLSASIPALFNWGKPGDYNMNLLGDKISYIIGIVVASVGILVGLYLL
jgi:NADH:ubiquinone oxidoreductase subunit 5 (subunit L)/multisubunit Na+/H+ antiporter MnhA subunit